MNLIIETDIGHDPDDFFALCYFQSVGVNIRAITVAEGDPDQVAVARMFCREVGLDIPIGVAKTDRSKMSSGGVHYDLLKKYGHQRAEMHDGDGWKVMEDTFKEYPDCEVFVCGPMKSFGEFLRRNDNTIDRVTVQGGFLSYDLHSFPCKRLDKFEGKDMVPTFNLGGSNKDGLEVVNSVNIKERRFVSKNVCHTVVYDKDVHDFIKKAPINNKADELFVNGMDLYLRRHSEKKFPDPTAAVCHMHPEIAGWVRGKLHCSKGKWGTRLDENGDYIIANIDYDKLWNHIAFRGGCE